MSENKIIEIVNNNIIEASVRKIVENLLNSKKVKIVIEHGSKKGDNFVGSVYRVFYGYKHDSEEKFNYSTLFLKIAPTKSIYRENLLLHRLFLREIHLYSKVLPFFHEFQVSKGINPIKNGFHEYAKYYYSDDTDMDEHLLLEDLRPKGFEMIDYYQTEIIDFDQVSLVMKALGKFHAISFAVRDQHPNKFEKLTSVLTDLYHRDALEPFKEELFAVLQRPDDADLLKKVNEALVNGFVAMGRGCVNGKSAGKYAVICHGDAWVNNIMFKKDKIDKTEEIRLIDWQYSNCSSPVIDLVLYLMCSLSKELRDQHYNDFLHIYHNSLCDMLIRLGSDPLKLFPYNALLEQLRQFGRFSLVPSAILLKFLKPDFEMDSLNDVGPNSNEANTITKPVIEKTKPTDNQISVRAREMIIDLANLGYI